MNDLILNTSVLPEPLLRMIRTDKVRVRETDGVITMMPVEDVSCPLLGLLADYEDYTLDSFLKRKHAEKGLEF